MATSVQFSEALPQNKTAREITKILPDFRQSSRVRNSAVRNQSIVISWEDIRLSSVFVGKLLTRGVIADVVRPS